jgi:hypothetical protein
MRKDVTDCYGASSSVWRSLPESEMCAVLMVVANILREPSFQVVFSAHGILAKQYSRCYAVGLQAASGIVNAVLDVIPNKFAMLTQVIYRKSFTIPDDPQILMDSNPQKVQQIVSPVRAPGV